MRWKAFKGRPAAGQGACRGSVRRPGDQALLQVPLFVGEDYELEREVIALSGSRRTESLWLRTSVFGSESASPLATMLLNLATIKESYALYSKEYDQLYA
jgi:hypothetical protein